MRNKPFFLRGRFVSKVSPLVSEDFLVWEMKIDLPVVLVGWDELVGGSMGELFDLVWWCLWQGRVEDDDDEEWLRSIGVDLVNTGNLDGGECSSVVIFSESDRPSSTTGMSEIEVFEEKVFFFLLFRRFTYSGIGFNTIDGYDTISIVCTSSITIGEEIRR